MRKLIAFALAALAASLASPAAAMPIPSFSVADASAAENSGAMRVTVSKSVKTNSYSRIAYQVHSGTARPGVDYVYVSGALTFTNGQLTNSFSVPLIDNAIVDGSRTFTVQISVVRFGTIARGLATATITDNDVAPPPPPPPSPATQKCPDGTVILATSVCPAPVPPPVPVAGYVPSPSLAGMVATTAPDFVLSSAVQIGGNALPSSAAPDVVGAFRFICTAGQVLADDPIVYPGQPGASHLHQFYGNTAADAYSTYDSLRAKGTSSCQPGIASPANRSSYWMPAMLDGAGNVVKPVFVSIYYKRRPITDPKCSLTSGDLQAEGNCLPIPNGIRFIFGHDMLTGETPTGSLWFNCQSPNALSPIPGVVPGHYANLTVALANCPVGAWVGAVIEAPECWDGKNLDSPNHRDHVSYPSYGTWGYRKCPPGFPYVIPTFTLGAWYPVASGMHLSSDEMVAGAEPGSTFHADYFEGWDPTVKAMWEDNCIDKMLNCSAGDLGNGDRLIGAAI